MVKKFTLHVLADDFMVCKLDKDATVPGWAFGRGFLSITRTPQELSIVCEERDIPKDVVCERGWKVLEVEGPLGFSLTGIIASLTKILADHGVSVFVVSTYDTDYVLVKKENLDAAIGALTADGHCVKLNL